MQDVCSICKNNSSTGRFMATIKQHGNWVCVCNMCKPDVFMYLI